MVVRGNRSMMPFRAHLMLRTLMHEAMSHLNSHDDLRPL